MFAIHWSQLNVIHNHDNAKCVYQILDKDKA